MIHYFKRRTALVAHIEQHHPFLLLLLRALKGNPWQLVPVDYPVNNQYPRYGYGKPPNRALLALVDRWQSEYRQRLEEFSRIAQPIRSLPYWTKDEVIPYWYNGWFSSLDAFALYGFVASSNAQTFLEIGSGHSTRFARRAIQDHGLGTRIVSIDPHPRSAIDSLCDHVIRKSLEDVHPSEFPTLKRGDILFFDGSHRSFMNSDVTVFFLEVLPSLPPGVLIHIHDIYLPFDYPSGNLFYNEQYLLAAHLLASSNVRVLMPNAYVSTKPEILTGVGDFWDTPALESLKPEGESFWMTHD